MAQRLAQIEEQQLIQQQQQRLSAQQVMTMHLLQMPIAQLEQNVQTEMDENPALEGEYDNVNDNGTQSDEILLTTSAQIIATPMPDRRRGCSHRWSRFTTSCMTRCTNTLSLSDRR